ncbi:hypothetical protein N7451_011349 [Penicillium sp. IBT 35674x]|nr:hypothetical protein N7451_011349 [Penicillium sp. IBT 35674x]
MRVASFGRFIDAYFEHYLEATLARNSGSKNLHCFLISSPTPITDFETKRYPEYEERIVSQRLVMGKDFRHSIGQKWERLLGSSQIPRYSFSLELDFALGCR